eukprot:scaffold5277_cov404-Prasinococcus_capsulatus_cf.AAC.7
MSSRVTNIEWPMCSAPVTLGGGIGTVYGSPLAAGLGLKKPEVSHHRYSLSSVPSMSKFLGSSLGVPGPLGVVVLGVTSASALTAFTVRDGGLQLLLRRRRVPQWCMLGPCRGQL